LELGNRLQLKSQENLVCRVPVAVPRYQIRSPVLLMSTIESWHPIAEQLFDVIRLLFEETNALSQARYATIGGLFEVAPPHDAMEQSHP
jgi:hypothetical protein